MTGAHALAALTLMLQGAYLGGVVVIDEGEATTTAVIESSSSNRPGLGWSFRGNARLLA